LHFDSNTAGDRTHCSVFGEKIRTYPVSDTAASATTLDGTITATAKTLVLTKASEFREPGRLIIDSEVIGYDRIENSVFYGATDTQFDITNTSGDTFRYTYDSTGTDPGITALVFPVGTIVKIKAPEMTSVNEGTFTVTGSGADYFEVTNTDGEAMTNKTLAGGFLAILETTSNTLSGLRRGLEGTTAAAHTTGAVVTERDFVGTGHREPSDLVDMDDETLIPEPRILEYGASMELALVKMNDQVLHDRLKLKYEDSILRLRDKFSRKLTGSYFAIADKDNYPRSGGGIVNPNNYPTNLS